MSSEGVIQPPEHWLLAGTPAEESQALLAAGHETRYLPGEVIFREGEPSDGLYLVTAGSVRVTATGSRGEALLAVIKANEVLGEMGVLDGRPRSATASALSVCAIYFLPAEPFLDLIERSNSLAMRLIAVLTERVRRANDRLVEMVGSEAEVAEEPWLTP